MCVCVIFVLYWISFFEVVKKAFILNFNVVYSVRIEIRSSRHLGNGIIKINIEIKKRRWRIGYFSNSSVV